MARLVVLSLLILLNSVQAYATPQGWTHGKIIICSEDAGWPPFSFLKQSEDEDFRGFNADLLQFIAERHNIEYEVVVRPWKRCLRDGKVGDVHIILDAASNPQREIDYLLTDPIYELTPVFFFASELSERFSGEIDIEALKNLFVCGQKGYTYTNFGFDNDKVVSVSKDLNKLMSLTHIRRCEVGLGRKEILLSESATFEAADEISYREIPNVPAEQFYWMLNRSAPFVDELKQLIDEEVAALWKSGEAARLLNVYLQQN